MATATATGNGYILYVDVWESSYNAATNTSVLSYQLALRADTSPSGFSGYSPNTSATYVVINGVGTYYSTAGQRTVNRGSTVVFFNGSVTVGHDANGTGAWSFYGRLLMQNPYPSISYMPPDMTTNTVTVYATDFDRSPTTPSISSTSRTANGTSFSAVVSGNVNNSGPTVTWTLQRADDLAFTTNVVDVTSTTTSGTTLTSGTLTDTKTYYYRTKASNSDTTGGVTNPKYSSVVTSYGVPGPPTALTATQSTTDAGKINLSWTPPTNTQGGITGYDIFVNDVYVESTTGTSLANIKSTSGGAALVPGTSYTYKVAAKNATNTSLNTVATLASSITSGSSAVAPGIPSAPTFGTNPPTKVGRNVTVTVTNDANGYGNAISNYYVQYRSATTSGGTYSSWSTPVVMTTSGGNKTYTYNLLPAALWYQFRVYAKNSIVNNSSGVASYYPDVNSSYTANFSPSTNGTTTMFVSAGGRRYRGTGETNPSTYQPTETAKRYGVEGAPPLSQTVKYWDLTTAKRYNGSAWVDLT